MGCLAAPLETGWNVRFLATEFGIAAVQCFEARLILVGGAGDFTIGGAMIASDGDPGAPWALAGAIGAVGEEYG